MRNIPEGGELDTADDVCRRCKKNSSSGLSCIGKRTREGCDRGSEVGTVHNGQDGEGPVPLRKPKEPGRSESCDKISSPSGIAGMFHLCNDQGHWAGNMGKWKCSSGFGERICQSITR